MQTNYRTFYTDSLAISFALLPTPEEYRNQQGIAYWQWAGAVMTSKHNNPRVPSVTKIVNTVTGYPEISFFVSDVLQNSQNMTAANIQAMSGVQLWDTQEVVDGQPPTTNYEYLFSLIGSSDSKDPDANSLFNVTTLQTLIKLGQNTTNIVKNPDKTYGVDFDIDNDEDWIQLQTYLGLKEVRQVYVIWLWMDTAYDYTFARVQSGGDVEIGVLGTLGATALNVTMT